MLVSEGTRKAAQTDSVAAAAAAGLLLSYRRPNARLRVCNALKSLGARRSAPVVSPPSVGSARLTSALAGSSRYPHLSWGHDLGQCVVVYREWQRRLVPWVTIRPYLATMLKAP